MFATFFTELKQAGVLVTLREYLTLMEAMDKNLAGRRSRNSTICRARRWLRMSAIWIASIACSATCSRASTTSRPSTAEIPTDG